MEVTPITTQTPSPIPPTEEVVATVETVDIADQFESARLNMVEFQIEPRGIDDPVVLQAMRTVPRHEFVPELYLDSSYADHPLPIGYGQTISQPYIVALMSQSLRVEAGDKVLEIGTGSGYQAAVLAAMGVEVYSVEIIPQLSDQARERLDALGYGDVGLLNADGYFGWDEHAPYDAIIVTAAPDHLPQPLVGQLKDGGRLIIPIGPQGSFQTLWLFERFGEDIQATNLAGVTFVPLTRDGDP